MMYYHNDNNIRNNHMLCSALTRIKCSCLDSVLLLESPKASVPVLVEDTPMQSGLGKSHFVLGCDDDVVISR